MTGVFGYIGSAAPATAVAQRMGARLRHHAHQVVEVAGVATGAIGRVGLGLLNREPQPVEGAAGAVQLCLAGEFYHQRARHATLAREVALPPDDHARLALEVYLRAGAAGLTTLDGAFTICVWDARSGELCLVNDRYGLYQHVYAHVGRALVFAPELKGVLAAPGVSRTLDVTAIAEYVRFQQLLGERTWFEDIQLLPPATLLRYQPATDRLALQRYWDWDRIRPTRRIAVRDAVEETVGRFQRAVDAMTTPPLRVGVYLSGGLDSRTILGFIDPATPVTTLTYGAAGCRDVVYGAALARRAQRSHHWFPFTDGQWVLRHADRHLALTEGFHSWMHAHGMSTLERARTLIDVHLTGWDGGTIMGGRIDEYETDDQHRFPPDEATRSQRLFEGFCQRFTWPGLTDAEAVALTRPPGRPDLVGLARASFERAVAGTVHYDSPYRADYFYLQQHVRRSTQNMIVFQRSAFEVRCPFFDYALVEFLYSLPVVVFANPAFHRAVLTRRQPRLALVPYDKTDQLPHSSALLRAGYRTARRAQRLVNRVAGPIFPARPRLYADYEQYLRSDLRAWAEDLLLSERAAGRGFFHPDMVRRLWERHLRGDELWTIGKIAPLLTLELVFRSLVDEAPVAAGPIVTGLAPVQHARDRDDQ